MNIPKSMDKVAKVAAVRRRAFKAFSKLDAVSYQVAFPVVVSIAILANYHGLEFQRKYILINKVLAKIEQEGARNDRGK